MAMKANTGPVAGATSTNTKSSGLPNTGLGIKPSTSNSGYDSRGIPIAYSPDKTKSTDSGYAFTGNKVDPNNWPNGNKESPKPKYTPTGGGGGGDSGGSSSPSVDTSYDPYAEEMAAAAETTKRITEGVDLTEKINSADQAWKEATQNYGTQANEILGGYKQDTAAGIDQYQGNAQAIIDQLSNLTGQELADYAASTGQTIADATKQINDILSGLQANLQPVEAGRVGRVDTTEKENILQEMTNNQREQATNQINYAVDKGVKELQRAEEDAQAQFQAQRDQIAGQERTALDNQALYAEMRGDRGGIGQAQYGAIQNNAATNQLTVNKEQTKLATDTARQIADLRAQGEFDLADKYLEISQEYLGKLMQLKQWADEMNISIDEFNIGVDQWEQEYNAKLQETLGELGINAVQYQTGLGLDRQQYLTNQGLNRANTEATQRLGLESDVNKQRQSLNEALAQYGLSNAQYMTNQDINRLTGILSAYQQNAQNLASTELAAANVTGAFSDKTQTMAQREAIASRQAAAAQQMIAAGVTPTDAQLKALGWNKDQYNAYKAVLAAAASSGGGGGGRRDTFYAELQDAIETGLSYEAAMQAINQAEASGKHTDKVISDSRALVESGNSKGLLGKVK